LLLVQRGASLEPKVNGKGAREWAQTVARANPSEAARRLLAVIEEHDASEAAAKQQMAQAFASPNAGGVKPAIPVS
jgi:uncharacterized membrane-anchored protein